MKRINTDKIYRLWSLIIYIHGKSKYRKDLPFLRFRPGKDTDITYGEYYPQTNTVEIKWKPHLDFKDLSSTMLHEYAHYLQFWPWYVRYREMYKYDDNPYEVEARIMEKEAPDLIRMISPEEWSKAVKKKKKLLRIYRDINKKIIIEL